MPDSSVFGKEASKKLTAKQKKFARNVAQGMTKANAYRSAYDVNSVRTMRAEPYRLAANPSVAREIEAIEQAIRAQEYQTPAGLRSLVINTFVSVITNPDAKPSEKINAAKALGTITEVAAFTDRKEIRTISSSESARQEILAQLTELIKAEASDAKIIEADADSLLRELSGEADTHSPATPHDANGTPADHIHTIPPEQSADFDAAPEENFPPDADPTPSVQEDPR